MESTTFRISHGDVDGACGIVIDEYDAVCVVQSHSPTADFILKIIESSLSEIFNKRVFERSTGQTRRMAGLSERTRWVTIPAPQTGFETSTRFAGLTLSFALNKAQKTGLFLDQRENLLGIRKYIARVASVLDICCYAGAWSATAAAMGANLFTCIDQDAAALDCAKSNIEKNFQSRTPGITETQAELVPTIHSVHGDLFESLGVLKKQNQTFDLVVADPPAFAKTQKQSFEARKAYMRLAKLSASVTSQSGVLVLCSCTRYVSEEEFLRCVFSQLPDWVLIFRGQQSPDHTVTAQGGEYLKCFAFQRKSW